MGVSGMVVWCVRALMGVGWGVSLALLLSLVAQQGVGWILSLPQM